MQIELSLDLGALEERTEAMAERLADFTPFWEAVASPLLARWFTAVWETEGAAIGEPWAPLSETTLALKAARGRGNQGMLRDSDRLFHSLTVRGDADQLRESSPSSFFYGTQASSKGAPYPLFLQKGWRMHSIFGHEVAPRDVPARPFVPASLPGSWATLLHASALDYVQSGVLGFGA